MFLFDPLGAEELFSMAFLKKKSLYGRFLETE